MTHTTFQRGVSLFLATLALAIPGRIYGWTNNTGQTVTIEWSSSGQYYYQSASGDATQGPWGESNNGTEVIPAGGYFADGEYSWSEPGSDGDEIFHSGTIAVDNVILPASPPTVSITVSAGAVNSGGGTVDVSWSSKNADTVVSTSWFSAGSVSGSTTSDTFPANNSTTDTMYYTISITVSGPGGTASASAVVSVSTKSFKHVGFDLRPTSFVYNGGSQGPAIQPTESGATFEVSGTQSAVEVGTYTFTVTATGDYEGEKTCTWAIEPKPVRFSFDPTTFTYDAGSHSPSVSPSDGGASWHITGGTNSATAAGDYSFSVETTDKNYVGSDTCYWSIGRVGVSCDFGATSFTYDGGTKSLWHNTSNNSAVSGAGTDLATDAGSYTYTYSLNDTNNYYFENGNSATWTIDPKSVSFSFSNLAQTYDGGTKSADVSASDSGAMSSAQLDVTKGPNVGQYTVSATATGNYSGSGTDTLTISKQTIYCNWGAANFVYNRSPQSLAHGTSNDGVVSGSGTDNATDAGTYTYSYSLNDPENYEFGNSSGQTWTIVPKPVAFTFGDLSHMYDGHTKTASVAASDSGATFNADLTKGPAANSYAVSASAYGNYSGSGSNTLTISRAPQTVGVTPANITLTAGESATFSASGGQAGYRWGGTAGASGTVNSVSVMFPAEGKFTVTVYSPDSADYARSNVAEANITVNPAIIPTTFAFSPKVFQFDGSMRGPVVTPAPGNATYVTSGITSAINAGNYSFSATGTGKFSGEGSCDWTIAPKPVTFSVSDLEVTYSGSPHAVSVQPSDLTATYSVSYSSTDQTTYPKSNVPPTNAGEYDVTIQAFGNYAGSAPAKLTVAKAPLTVAATDATRPYGQDNPALQYAITGFVGSERENLVSGTPALSTSATRSSGADDYAIDIGSGTLAAANYSFARFVPGILRVTKAPLAAKADDQARVFGAANPSLTISYAGFVNGDEARSITPPVAATTAIERSPVGLYGITLSGGAATNYTLVLQNGTLAVTKALLVARANDQTKVYGSDNPALTITYSGFVNGEDESSITPPTASTTATQASGVSDYAITLSGGAAGSYVLDLRPGTLHVTPKPITFQFADLLHTYDGAAKTARATPSDSAATFSTDLTKGPGAGTYTVRATATGNFTGSGEASLVISPAAQTIALTPGNVMLFVGQPATFHATGGQGPYVWGGTAGASGSGADATLTFGAAGSYSVSVYSAANNDFLPSNTARATITVVSNHQVNTLVPLESTYTVSDASSPMHGQTYRRIWQEGGWVAYLGRAGVRFNVKAQAWPAVKTVELQSKSPGGDWAQLEIQSPSDAPTSVDTTFSVMLGRAAPGQPLVPASFAAGSPQTGEWRFRARVQDANGEWSEFSPEVPVQVVLPVVTRTVSGQTVPPAGELGKWFTASSEENFSLQLWIP
jgi:hypothetical protein